MARLNRFPGHVPGLENLGEGLWLFNIGLFALFSPSTRRGGSFFFDGASRIFGHSVVSMFFGCIPMGLATIVNGFLAFGVARWGQGAVDVAEALWWLDAALSVLCGVPSRS